MKKIILLLTLMLSLTFISFGQNVSTGIGAVGSTDSWLVGTTISPSGPTYVLPTTMFTGIWEPTPVSPTNAKWISLSPSGTGSGMTNYYYEK